MDITQFKAGIFKKQLSYHSFSPNLINHNWTINDARLNQLLSNADRKLGELNAFAQLVVIE